MTKLNKIPVTVAIVLLLMPVIILTVDSYQDIDSGYFTLLRIIVCGVAVYIAIVAKVINKQHWMWIAGFIAILFNPIIPIYLERENWQVIDFITAAIFVVIIFALNTKDNLLIRMGLKDRDENISVLPAIPKDIDMPRYCSKCGTGYDKTWKVCLKCSTTLKENNKPSEGSTVTQMLIRASDGEAFDYFPLTGKTKHLPKLSYIGWNKEKRLQEVLRETEGLEEKQKKHKLRILARRGLLSRETYDDYLLHTQMHSKAQ